MTTHAVVDFTGPRPTMPSRSLNETRAQRRTTTERILASLYRHQHEGIARLANRRGRCAIYWEMGTGKTRLALSWAYAKRHRRVLVFCPVSTAGVWQREVEQLGIPYEVTDITHGPVHKRPARLPGPGGGQVVLVNYESGWRKPLRAALERWAPDMIVFDEGHRIRNRTTRQARFCHALADSMATRSVLLLSGTPVVQGWEDVWGQLRVIDRAALGSWAEFERRHLVKGGYSGYQITGYLETDRIQRIIAAHSHQVRKDAVLDLPPRVDVVVPVRLDAQTRRVYDQMAHDAIAELQALDEQRGLAVARIILTVILRLQQCTGGWMRDQLGNDLDVGSEKLDATGDLVRDAVAGGERVVVFARFRHDLDRLEQRLADYRVTRLDGETPGPERSARLAAFARGEYDVFLVQLRAGSVGIDLTAASVAIYYSSGYSLEDWLQARDRIHRPGQTRPVTYYHLIASQSVDEDVYAALSAKVNIAGQAVNLSYAKSLLVPSSSRLTLV